MNQWNRGTMLPEVEPGDGGIDGDFDASAADIAAICDAIAHGHAPVAYDATGTALAAASLRADTCQCGDLVGVDMLAADGMTFAHGHFDVKTAKLFHDKLGEAITKAEANLRARLN